MLYFNSSDNEEEITKHQRPPMMDLNYNVSSHEILGKKNEMKHSESLLGKKEVKSNGSSPRLNPISNKKNESFCSSSKSTIMNKSQSSGSAESIFSISKLNTAFTEDAVQISTIFDKDLFD